MLMDWGARASRQASRPQPSASRRRHQRHENPPKCEWFYSCPIGKTPTEATGTVALPALNCVVGQAALQCGLLPRPCVGFQELL